MSSPISFDLETAPLPDEELEKGFDPKIDESKYQPTEFDPESVKYGRMTDPQKRADKLEEVKAKHAKEMAALPKKRQAAIDEAWSEFKGKAALQASTCRVIAGGFYGVESKKFIPLVGDEQSILSAMWESMDKWLNAGRKIIGHNIVGFDLPLAIQRSWALGVDVPRSIFTPQSVKWPKFHFNFVDTLLVFRIGTNTTANFKRMAVHFGTAGKHEGHTGADFAELLKSNKEMALAYLEEDCKQPGIWAQKMGVI